MIRPLAKLKFLGSPFFSIIFLVIFFVLIYRYWFFLNNLSFYLKSLLFSLRFLVLIIILLLIINPWFSYTHSTKTNQNISIIFDFSESMFAHFKNMDYSYDSVIKKIKSKFDKHKVNSFYFSLSEHMQMVENNIDTLTYTYFTKMPNFLSSQNPDQVILVTDGVATSGLDFGSIKFTQKIPINILGVGNTTQIQDISIDKILYPPKINKNEIIDIEVYIISNVNSDINSRLNIKNNTGKVVYDEPVYFNSGSQRKKLTISLLSNDLDGFNTASLSTLTREQFIDNNRYTFSLNINPFIESIIMVSGSLSPNTSIIKSSILNIDHVDLDHYYRIENNEWNIEVDFSSNNPSKMLVLDDFPSNNLDIPLFNKIYEYSIDNNIPIVYLEGPKSSLLSANIISSKIKILNPTIIRPDLLSAVSLDNIGSLFSGIDFNMFPPQSRNVKWISSQNNIDLQYTDGSMVLGGNDLFYIVSLPGMMEAHIKSRVNISSPVYLLLDKIFIDKFYGNQGMIAIHINEDTYDRGEKLNVKLAPVEELELSEIFFKTISPTFDTLLTPCQNDYLTNIYDCSIILKNSGSHKISGLGTLDNGNFIESVEKTIYVQDVNIELKELIQYKSVLEDVAYKTSGIYMPIDSLEAMLNSIQINPLNLIKKDNVSGIKTYKYWWILIFLLSIEWYVRKKIGLL